MTWRLNERLIEKIDLCNFHKERIHPCRMEVNALVKALKVEVDSVIDDEIKPVKEQEKRNADVINREIDMRNEKHFEEIRKNNEEIRKNNDERQRRLESNKTDSELQLAPVEHKRRELIGDIQNITEVIELKIVKVETSLQDVMATTENAKRALAAATMDHSSEVEDAHHLNRSVTYAHHALKMPLDADGVERITRSVSGLRFVKGAGREKYNGRIDGYNGEWRLVEEINISETIKLPTIVGCIDAFRVLITDRVGYMHTYLLDISTRRIKTVIIGTDTRAYIISSALLGDGRIVCGRRRTGCTTPDLGRCLTGCISVYDRHWKLINDFTIPRNTTRDDTWVDVAADPDGMIIAAEWGQSKIYVLNPTNGNIIHTITCTDNIAVRGVQSSGHIVARPSSADCKVFRMDRGGAHQREIPCKNVIRNVCIDPLTDVLYVVTSDDEYKKCVIDQVIWRGRSESKKRRVVSIDLSPRLMQTGADERRSHLVLSQVIMTSTGKLIACNGNKIICITKDIISLR